HRIGSAPEPGTKKFVPVKRSNISSTSATVITGNARMIRNDVTSVIHVNGGMRMSFMPGARRLMIVTMKLNAAASEAMPRIWSPIAQKSTPCVGEYWLDVRFEEPNQPTFGAPPRKKLRLRKMPPNRKTQ